MNSVMTTKEPIAIAGMTIQFLVESEESNGSVSVFRCDMPSGARPAAPHSHDGFEETVYGLKGEITWTVDGEKTVIGPGEVVVVPRGAVHGFAVTSEEDASMLCIASPGLFGPAYFREMAEVLSAGGPPDVPALMAVMKRHGLTPAAA
jgi:quercetin dioxygenase-like cupin family protein